MHDDASSNSSKQDKLQRFVETNVIWNQTHLVEDKLFDIDEVENLTYTEGELKDIGYSDVEEAMNDGADVKEVFQWFLVTDRFADRLNKHHEPLIRNDYGNWWGRTCCGQAIDLDAVIEAIFDEL